MVEGGREGQGESVSGEKRTEVDERRRQQAEFAGGGREKQRREGEKDLIEDGNEG